MIYYRFSVDPSLLEEVGVNISDAFDTSFTPSQLFVATWDRAAAIIGSVNVVSKSILLSSAFRRNSAYCVLL